MFAPRVALLVVFMTTFYTNLAIAQDATTQAFRLPAARPTPDRPALPESLTTDREFRVGMMMVTVMAFGADAFDAKDTSFEQGKRRELEEEINLLDEKKSKEELARSLGLLDALLDSFRMGLMHGPAKNKEEKERAAQAGFAIGYLLRQAGPDFPGKDPALACDYFEYAGTLGYSDGFVQLGNCFKHGEGRDQNDYDARRAYMNASSIGDVRGSVLLGDFLVRGRGGARKISEGLSILRKESANKQDDLAALAASYLGDLYFDGDGVLQDFIEAHAWASICLSKGGSYCKKLLSRTEQKLTPELVIDAQARAKTLARQGGP